jgi:sugar lactone lactonase YvrE
MKQSKLLIAVVFLLTTVSMSVYAQLPLTNNMPASGVLGTSDFVTNTNYAPTSDTTLAEPKGIAVDPTTGKLFVADYENRRVLRWSSVDKMVNGAAAEAVLGQPDFISNTAGTSATIMSRPYGVYVDAAGRLWVTDLSNNRVLRFDNASTIPSGSPANKVLGQPDFVTGTDNTGGISASTMNRPISVFGDVAGNLYVSDRDNRRVLRFNNAAAKDNGDPADGVLGQPDFVTTTAGLDASTLGNRAWGVFVDGTGRLWVCDRDNHRVLGFDNAAAKPNGAAADVVLGQADFVSNATALNASGLSDPKGVFVDGLGRLFVADEGNNRIKVYNNASTIGFLADADYVLGQPDFISSSAPNPPTASSLNYAEYLWIDNSANHIWVTDEYNHRILRFDALVVPVELVSFTATAISNKVELRWSTATEKNNAGFVVEKNTHGVWNQIGYIEGHGTSTETNNYLYIDNTSAGKYQYRLKQIDLDGSFEYSNEVEVTVELTPKDYQLSQNYPNPFNPSTTITFVMKNTEYVTVKVHNMLGQEVATLFEGIANADEVYSLSFDAQSLSSGVYLYTLNSASKNEVKKMSLMK